MKDNKRRFYCSKGDIGTLISQHPDIFIKEGIRSVSEFCEDDDEASDVQEECLIDEEKDQASFDENLEVISPIHSNIRATNMKNSKSF